MDRLRSSSNQRSRAPCGDEDRWDAADEGGVWDVRGPAQRQGLGSGRVRPRGLDMERPRGWRLSFREANVASRLGAEGELGAEGGLDVGD